MSALDPFSGSCPAFGWVGGERVPISWGNHGPDSGVVSDPFADDGVDRDGFDWPSEVDSVLFVEHLTPAQAACLASNSREQLVLWMAGAGLDPAAVARRWMLGAARLVPVLADTKALNVLRRDPAAWEGFVGSDLFGSVMAGRTSLARARSVLAKANAAGRYEILKDDRALDVMAEWVAVESVDCSEVGTVEARVIVLHSMESLLKWLGMDRGGLFPVLQRFYALAFECYKVVSLSMTGADFGPLLGQKRATFSAITTRLFEDPLEILLGFVPKVAGQKSAAASEKYRENAKTNCPRRMLEGTAGLNADERARLEQYEDEAEASAQVPRLSQAEMDRLGLVRDAEEFTKKIAIDVARIKARKRKKNEQK